MVGHIHVSGAGHLLGPRQKTWKRRDTTGSFFGRDIGDGKYFFALVHTMLGERADALVARDVGIGLVRV